MRICCSEVQKPNHRHRWLLSMCGQRQVNPKSTIPKLVRRTALAQEVKEFDAFA
jgi:hypothetical protein